VGRINRILNKANNIESISFKDHMIDTNKMSRIDGEKSSFCFDLERVGACYTYYQFKKKKIIYRAPIINWF
jgi:hypothetical protein